MITTNQPKAKESYKTCPNCRQRNTFSVATGRCVWCKHQAGQAVDGKFKPQDPTAAEKQAIEVNSAQYRNPYNLAVEVRRQAMRPSSREPQPTGYNVADTREGEPF
jgi:hypothetical protein